MTQDGSASTDALRHDGPLEALLAELVAIASPTSDPTATARVLTIVRDRLAPLGFEGGLVAGNPGGAPTFHHLYMERRHAVGSGERPAARVLVMGHADTVHEHAARFAGYWREGERGRGPGVADAKGGLAVLVGMLERLPRDLPVDLTVFVSADEEDNGVTSRHLIADAARGADLCLDFEPARPDGSLVRGRRGVARFHLVATGRAAHAGQAHAEGANAIVALAVAIDKASRLSDPVRGVTVSPGIVSGGTRVNVVPDRAEAWIDARADDAVGAEWCEERLRSIALANPIEGTHIEVEGRFSTPPWAPGPTTDALVAHWQAVARELGMDAPGAVVSGGGSDASQVAALGVPTLDGLGAVGGDYHSDREWVDVGSLEARARLHAAALEAWVAARGG
ncbi:MAG: M20/M25/M40 family metallo-hydrolase [Deltaproteobacteria bacterium]|nr:M20/M25/M40 family metallo-hydrolase [Deltaproteobacteria bacterium]